jgi:AcrR family transcriptional regulator
MAPRKAAALRDGDASLREHLIASAEQLIARQGLAGLTVRAIAKEAGVADGVLYNHFADKEELLAIALRGHVVAAERELGPLPQAGTGTVEENLRAQLRHGLALHNAILPAFAGLIGLPAVQARYAELADTGPDWRDRLIDYLRAERATGRLRADADVDAAAAVLVGICHEQVLSGLFAGGLPHASEPSIDAVIDTLLRGIGPDEQE